MTQDSKPKQKRSDYAAAVRRSKRCKPAGVSLRAYMSGLADLGDGVAKRWFANKRGQR